MRLINYEQFNIEVVYVAYSPTGNSFQIASVMRPTFCEYICTEKLVVFKENIMCVNYQYCRNKSSFIFIIGKCHLSFVECR